MTHHSDKTILDWLEERADDIVYVRDLSAGMRVTVSYCAAVSGCQVCSTGETLRSAVAASIEVEAAQFKEQEESKGGDEENDDAA
jgi:hypothetical protein